MQVAAFVISVVALAASAYAARRSQDLARHANTLPVLVELFKEHRASRLAEARRFVAHELQGRDPATGVEALPRDEAELVRELVWFYDNLGALVAHDVVDIEPVSGYLGTSVLEMWRILEPFIDVDRRRRADAADPGRWQMYFENLAALVRENPPSASRSKQRNWRLAET